MYETEKITARRKAAKHNNYITHSCTLGKQHACRSHGVTGDRPLTRYGRARYLLGFSVFPSCVRMHPPRREEGCATATKPQQHQRRKGREEKQPKTEKPHINILADKRGTNGRTNQQTNQGRRKRSDAERERRNTKRKHEARAVSVELDAEYT